MLSERENIHFEISKQKKIKYNFSLLYANLKKSFNLTKSNLSNWNIGILKLKIYFSNTQLEIFEVKPHF